MTKEIDIRAHLVKEIPTHPKNVVSFLAKRFKLSRQAIHWHLDSLLADGTVIKSGQKRGTSYFLASAKAFSFSLKLTPDLREHAVWTDKLESRCADFSENVRRILEYGFTEMLNNAIDHSNGNRIDVRFDIVKNHARLLIIDNGVGIFQKIQRSLGLHEPREAILHLTKGKFTTDPSRHTGEGIFFTSRAFDTFVLDSDSISFIRVSDDWLIKSKTKHKGTDVFLDIDLASKRKLKDIFDGYSNQETHHFDETQVLVELAKAEGESYISRSQAKRILFGLEKFRRIALDFTNVSSVGQGFVDEVFRVFKNQNPGIEITYIKANNDVEFMIRRSLSA